MRRKRVRDMDWEEDKKEEIDVAGRRNESGQSFGEIGF